MEITELLEKWESGEGKPYKGKLIDMTAFAQEPESAGCMCAQGQVLHYYAGWDVDRLSGVQQSEADKKTATILRISRAHAVLLRNINDRQDGAPAIVLTDPQKVLGDQWSKLLDFWWMLDQYEEVDWHQVSAARAAAGGAAWDAARAAAGGAAGDAARAAAGAAAWDAAWDAAGDAAGGAAWGAARAAAWEIQGFQLLGERGHDVFFLPIFGIETLDDIPARPADYGLGVVPSEQS